MKVSTAQDRHIDHSAFFSTLFRLAALLLRLGWRKFVRRKEAGLTVLLGGAGYGVVLYRIFSLPAGALPQGLGWGLLGLQLLYGSWSALRPSRAEASVRRLAGAFPVEGKAVEVAKGLRRSLMSLATAALLIPLAWRSGVLGPFTALVILLTLAAFPAAFLHAARERKRQTGASPSKQKPRPLFLTLGRLIRGNGLPGMIYGLVTCITLAAVLLPSPLQNLLRGNATLVLGAFLAMEAAFSLLPLMDEDAVLRQNFVRAYPFPWSRWQTLLHAHHFILYLLPRAAGLTILLVLGVHADWYLRLALGMAILAPSISDPPILRGLAITVLGFNVLAGFTSGVEALILAVIGIAVAALAFGRRDWIHSIRDSGRNHERLARLP